MHEPIATKLRHELLYTYYTYYMYGTVRHHYSHMISGHDT